MESEDIKQLIHDYIRENLSLKLAPSTNGCPEEGIWSINYTISLRLRNPTLNRTDEIDSIDIEVPPD